MHSQIIKKDLKYYKFIIHRLGSFDKLLLELTYLEIKSVEVIGYSDLNYSKNDVYLAIHQVSHNWSCPDGLR